MKDATLNEQLFRKLMMIHRKMRRNMDWHGHPEPHEGHPFPKPGEPHRHRPPLAREHILETIAAAGNGMRQKEICEQIHVNPSSMSEFINQLEKDGYVTRTLDPADKRATLVKLTEMGTARAAELQDERDERFQGLFKSLSDEEKIQLNELLAKVILNSRVDL